MTRLIPSFCACLAVTTLGAAGAVQAQPAMRPPNPAPGCQASGRPGQTKPPVSVAGTWTTSQGPLVFTQACESATGSYGASNHLVGTLNDGEALYPVGVKMTGIWVEPTGRVACKTQQMGSPYWGEIYLNFSEDGKQFAGNWGYCGTFTGGTGWEGKWTGPGTGPVTQPLSRRPLGRVGGG